jgi:hypothetical protein
VGWANVLRPVSPRTRRTGWRSYSPSAAISSGCTPSAAASTRRRRHNKPALAPPGDSLNDLGAPFGGSAA